LLNQGSCQLDRRLLLDFPGHLFKLLLQHLILTEGSHEVLLIFTHGLLQVERLSNLILTNFSNSLGLFSGLLGDV